MERGYTREEIEQMQHSRVQELGADFIGNAVLTKYKDDLIFCSQFFREDVEYFRNKFKALREVRDTDYLWYSLKEAIEEKIMVDGDRNPIEPYLYALKLEDGCFGTELNGRGPDAGKMEAYVKAVHCIYEQSDKDIFFEVVKHVLVNWEWYQPLHVVIALCGQYPQFQDQEVDDILRSQLLYRKMYSKTTFDALISRPSISNYEELLKYLMTWNNKDVVTEAEIIADSIMLTKFEDAIKAEKNGEIFAYVQNTFLNKFRERAMKKWLRERLEKIFGQGEERTGWDSLFWSFKRADEEKRGAILQKVRMDFRVNKKEDMEALANIQDREILEVVMDKLEMAAERDRGWGILTLGKNNYAETKEYIKERYGEKKDDRECFVYMLASFLASGTPDLEQLCNYYFLTDNLANENLYGSLLKNVASSKKLSKVFQTCLGGLMAQDVQDPESASRLLSRLKGIFGNENSNAYRYLYPVEEMSSFLDRMLEGSLNDRNYVIMNDIIAILDKTAMDVIRDQYERMLIRIINETDEKSSQFKQAREILRRMNGR
ncbi:hypothetical protein D7X48_03655 [bacterium D16-50]|nr:hypothetical protein D7X48_03655 [bacterium D16-50]